MARDTAIEWCDHTFNPWVGCTKISPACDNCYAERWSKRAGEPELWQGARRVTGRQNWKQPLRWDAEATGPTFVFCASLADVFDNQVEPAWRDDLWRLVDATRKLTWLLLTKRPQNIAGMLPSWWGDGPAHVWLGTTAENQAEADRRIPSLLELPAKVRFLSCEPLLGPINAAEYYGEPQEFSWLSTKSPPFGRARIDWVIAGGESGPGARPSHPDWFRGLRDQCAEAGVPFFFKQWGEMHPHGQKLADGSINALGNPDDARWQSMGEGESLWRVGTKRAGALLDGREHRERPDA